MYKKFKFDLGRSALAHLIKLYNMTELHIPYYLCDVVRHKLIESGCKPIFYHIDDNFMPVKNFSKKDYILYPNYFGICASNVKKLTGIYPKLIVDNAHAYYDKPSGFATFYCGHKFGCVGAELFYDYENHYFESEITFHKDTLMKVRKNNFAELHKKYNKTNNLTNFINTADITSPFIYPYLSSTIEEADVLVKNLESEGKIIYRYWNELPKTYNEYKFYSKLVPIPLF